MQGIFSTLVAGSFCWFVASSLWVYPHSLSYFNESIGGPLNGPEHLLGSNVDWGQDLRYLVWRLNINNHSGSLFLAYMTCYDLTDIGMKIHAAPDAFSLTQERASLQAGLYAISANFSYGLPWFTSDGHGGKAWFSKNGLSGFRRLIPVERAGTSIYIYHIE